MLSLKTPYLYVFGYETPEDHAANRQGADQESFGFFQIVAESEEEALNWGHELSRWYTNHLFASDGQVHWDPAWFASWIERTPDERLKTDASALPGVRFGEYPNVDQIKAVLAD